MTIRHTQAISSPAARGFSMIDVLVAIVVLATALLALAALQGALTRNAADSRARSQIASYSEGLIDQMRATGYSSIPAGTTTIGPDCTGSATKQKAEACAVQIAAGVNNLQTTITSQIWYSDPSSGAFSLAVPTSVYGTYNQVNVKTTWTDATGASRQFAADTILSSVLLDQNNTALDDQTLFPSSASPIVREYDPGKTTGVIPIAIGDSGSSTAATNPQPEILGKNNNQFIGGVSFNVLTFTAADVNGESQITQNIATRVIRCNCKYGTQITSGIFKQPYRPTYWDGTQQKYVAPAKDAATVSTTGEDDVSEFVNGVDSAEQDTNCNICCRDRNDPGSAGGPRFNPWNASDNDHYRWVNANDTSPTLVASSGDTNAFVNACRLIIVDGQFRVATDMQNYFFGLVGTDTASVAKVPSGSSSTYTASSPLPTSTYKTDYQNFVEGYLLSINDNTSITTSTSLTVLNYPLNLPSATGSGNHAAAMYEKSGLASGGNSIPNNIDITYVDPGKNKTAACIPTGTQDCRYLHARGLYIDYLESNTLKAINNALHTCPGTDSTALSGCMFPLLPFTTINLTQLVRPSQSPGSAVSASNTALTGANPDQPLRDVVSALSAGTNGTVDNVISTIGLTNSGVIGTLTQPGISPTDASTNLSASQQFTLTSGGQTSASTLAFDVVLSGGSATSTPTVGWAGNSAYYTSGSGANIVACPGSGQSAGTITYIASGSCSPTNKQNPIQITASGVPSGSSAGVQITLQNYNIQNTGKGSSGNDSTCKSGQSAQATTCTVYYVSSVAVGSTPVPSWTSSPTASSGSGYTGLTALTTINVPSGLSSTSTTTPDLLNITLSKDTTYSYTPDASGNAGGQGYSCVLGSNGKYTYTAFTCHN